MPSNLNAYLVSAVMLAALLHCAPAAPLHEALTDNPAGDTSGDEWVTERPADPLMLVLMSALEAIKNHKEEFEKEFHIKYDFLDQYDIPSLPANCPPSNFSLEASLHRLLQGLPVYRSLLKFVEREDPDSLIPSKFRHYSNRMMERIREKMRHPAQAAELTSSQEEQLLKDIDSGDTFSRKMTAHSILYKLRVFLVDCKRVINKREKLRESRANGGAAPVTFIHQM